MVDWWFIWGIIIGVAFVLLVWAGLHIVYLENYIQEYQASCEDYQNACDNALNASDKLIKEYKNYTNSLLNQIETLQGNLTDLQIKYYNLATTCSEIQEDNLQLKKQNDNLKSQKGLINPTYEQLWDFVMKDNTNNFEWSKDFDCTEFSNRFIKNFAERGFYSCTTELTFDDDTGHIIVAVNTNKGVYFVEPQTDYLIRNDELRVGKDYCDIVNWDCDWKIRKISSCFELKI